MRHVPILILPALLVLAGCGTSLNPFSSAKKDEDPTSKPMPTPRTMDISDLSVGSMDTAMSPSPSATSSGKAAATERKGPKKGIPADAGIFERTCLGDALTTQESLSLEGCRMHNNMGNLELQKERIDHAEQRFLLAVRLVPDHVESLNNLGSVFLRQRKYEDAIKAFREALRIVDRLPDFDTATRATITCNLADTYRELRDYAAATEHYQAALKLSPEDPAIHYGLGQMNLKQVGLGIEFARNAVYRFNKTLNLQPDHNNALLGRALSWHALDQAEKALEDITELEKRGFDVDASFKRSVIRHIRRKQAERSAAAEDARNPEGAKKQP